MRDFKKCPDGSINADAAPEGAGEPAGTAGRATGGAGKAAGTAGEMTGAAEKLPDLAEAKVPDSAERKGRRFPGKNILQIAAFWGILLLILSILTGVFVNAGFGNHTLLHQKLKYLFRVQQEPENTLDLIVLGNSLSYTSVIPMQLWSESGISAYDVGHSGQSMQEAYETLKVILKTQKPKVVLLEAQLLFWGADGTSGWVDQLNTWLDFHVPLYHIHDLWKSFLMGKQYLEAAYKGYVLRDNVAPYTGGEYMTDEGETEDFAHLIEKDLDNMLSLCAENGIRLVLFSTASPANYTCARVSRIREYAEEHGIDYIDFNAPEMREAIGLDWNEDALDGGDHLNYTGAVKLTAYMAAWLKENCELSDHRGDESYASWNELAEQFYREVEKSRSKN